jgi:hypothetical protein
MLKRGCAAADEEEGKCDEDSDDDGRPPPGSKCWLCTFSNCKMAKQISAFVSANVGNMDPTIMADQIKNEVLREVR